MPERSVTVKISATDNFSSVVQRYNQAMGQAEQSTRKFGEESDRTGMSLDRFSTAVAGMVTAWGLSGVKNFAEDMYALGTQVNQTRQIFSQLASEIGDPTSALQEMREATLGVVDDLTLMGGANQFLRMNLATTGDELAKLTEIAVKLKRPTVDATTAIQDFAMLLSQQSILRLDNFGFSSGRVRDRINDLLESGEALNRSDAFRLAVLEEGQIALDRLGSAADVAGTSMARLQVFVATGWQNFGADFAKGVEGLTTGIELMLGLHPAQVTQMQQEADAFVEDLGAALTFAFNDQALKNALPLDFMQNFVGEALKVAQESPELLEDMTAFTHAVMNRFGQGVGVGAESSSFFQASRMLAEATVQIQAGNQAQRESVRLAEENARAEAERLAILEEEARIAREEGERAQLRGAIGADFFALEAQLAGLGVSRGFTDLLEGDVELPRWMTALDAQGFEDAADEAERILESMKEFDELDPDLFTDEQIEQMETIADETEKLANEADKAAKAFADIKLSEVFGQSRGGMQGEINDMVLQAMRDAGMSDEAIAAFQREGDLASGRETEGSLALQEQIVPKIADIAQSDPELAAWATSNLSAVLAQVALRKIDPNSPEFISMLEQAMGVQETGGGAAFTVTPFSTPNAGAVMQGNLAQTPEAMAQWFKDTYGIDMGAGAFSNIAGDLNLTPTPEELRPQIESAMASQMLETINQNGYTLVSKEEILASPSFQESVNQAVTATLAELTNPEGTPGNVNTSTLSGIQAQLAAQGINVSIDDLLAATGAESPNLVQPGDYTMQSFAPEGDFDIDAFFTDFETMSGHATTLKDDINTFWTDITASQGPAAAVETSMGQISTFADNVAARFKELTAKVQVVRVKIETEISGDGGQWISEQVRNNGGYVPGMVRD